MSVPSLMLVYKSAQLWQKPALISWTTTLKANEEWGNSNKLRERRNVFEFMDFTNLNLTNSKRTQRSGKSNILTEEAAEGR